MSDGMIELPIFFRFWKTRKYFLYIRACPMKLGRDVSRHNELDNWRNTHRYESDMATLWLFVTKSETDPGLWDRLIRHSFSSESPCKGFWAGPPRPLRLWTDPVVPCGSPVVCSFAHLLICPALPPRSSLPALVLSVRARGSVRRVADLSLILW